MIESVAEAAQEPAQREKHSYDQEFELQDGNTIKYTSKTGNLHIEFHSRKKSVVKVVGNGYTPTYENGVLTVENFNGHLYLPKSLEVLLDIKSKRGSITGHVAQQGNIRTKYGNISLCVYKELEVVTCAKNGRVTVSNMNERGKGSGIYLPPGNRSKKPQLKLSSRQGDIILKYFHPKKK